MLVRDSSGVTVSNSHFHELTIGLTHSNTTNLAITGNTFDLIRDDGIDGGGSSFVTIANNTFTNFDHVGDVHPDAIQFWTSGTTTAATDITVTGNVYTRGAGVAVQGIFFGNELNLPYKNVTVTDNTIVGAMFNGISIGQAANATVTGNVVIAADDQQSWLNLRSVTTATVADNIATSFTYNDSGVTASGDVLAATISASSLPTLVLPPSAVPVPAASSLLGFVDGPSPSGRTYNFAEQQMLGTAGSDNLRAAAIGISHLYGYDGNDNLVGGKNGLSSTLEGGRGDDIYTIYQAQDVIVENPGEGNDTVYSYISYTLGANVENLRAMAGGLTLTGNEGNNSLVAHADGSVLYGLGGDDILQGAAGNDRLFGGDGNDRITGGGGDDYLEGGAGNDTLSGGDGNDTILGGDGNDTIEGGAGLDILTGGRGADTFVYRDGHFNPADLASCTDVITDFNAAEGDKISLSLIDAKTGTAADDAFTFIGNQAFHGVAGELRFAPDGDGITVLGDTNGDGVADLAIHLAGVTTISGSNFFL